MADVFPGAFAQVRTNPSRSGQTAGGFALTSPGLVRACILGLVLSRAQPPAAFLAILLFSFQVQFPQESFDFGKQIYKFPYDFLCPGPS